MSAEPYDAWRKRIAAGLEAMPQHVEREMRPTAERMQGQAARRAPRRTGALMRSIQGTVERDSKGNVVAHLWSTHPGAAVQDTGGTIRRGRSALTVPIGVVTVSPRSAVGTFLLRSKDGRRFIASRLPGGQVRLMWRLMDSVRVPATRYATEAFRQAARAVEVDLLDAADKAVG